MAIGPTWTTDSWDPDAWAENSWMSEAPELNFIPRMALLGVGCWLLLAIL